MDCGFRLIFCGLIFAITSRQTLAIEIQKTYPFPCEIDKKNSHPPIIIYGENHTQEEASDAHHYFYEQSTNGNLIYLEEAAISSTAEQTPKGIPSMISLEEGHKEFKDFVLKLTRVITLEAFSKKSLFNIFNPNDAEMEHVFHLTNLEFSKIKFPKEVDPNKNPFSATNASEFESRLKQIKNDPYQKKLISNALQDNLISEAKQLDKTLKPYNIPGMPSVAESCKQAFNDFNQTGSSKKVVGLWQEFGNKWRSYFMSRVISDVYCRNIHLGIPLVVKMGSLHGKDVKDYLGQWLRNSQIENVNVEIKKISSFKRIDEVIKKYH